MSVYSSTSYTAPQSTAGEGQAPLASGLSPTPISAVVSPTASGNYTTTPTPQLPTNVASLNPFEDPAYASYMAGLGVSNSNLQAETALRQNGLTNQLQELQPQYQAALTASNNNIAGNAASRGILNSGERINNQTLGANQINGQFQNQENGIANQSMGLQDSLTQQLAANQISQAQQALQAQQNIALQGASLGVVPS